MKKPLDCNSSSPCAEIDLHIHSTASDGTLTPDEIIDLAVQQNLKAISITDHDTLAGAQEVLLHKIPTGLNFLTGVEISAEPPPSFGLSGSLHILGYAVNPANADLDSALSMLQRARQDRNPAIIKCLNHLNIDISLAEVIDNAGHHQIARPHIASLLVKKKYVGSIDEAFNRYLGNGRPAYVDKYRVSSSNAIELILGAGGIPVLAHPVLIDVKNTEQFEKLTKLLISMGLKGLEVYYPEHSIEDTIYYNNFCRQQNLLITGGTDFHGAIKPDIQMGIGRGNLAIPFAIFEALIKSLDLPPAKFDNVFFSTTYK